MWDKQKIDKFVGGVYKAPLGWAGPCTPVPYMPILFTYSNLA